MKKRPTSAVGYKRPISQYARVAIAMRAHSRYRVGFVRGCLKLRSSHFRGWTRFKHVSFNKYVTFTSASFLCIYGAGWEHHVSGARHDSSKRRLTRSLSGGRAEPKSLSGQLAHQGQRRPQVSLLVRVYNALSCWNILIVSKIILVISADFL